MAVPARLGIRYEDWCVFLDDVDGYGYPRSEDVSLFIRMDLYRKLDIYLKVGDGVRRMSFILNEKEMDEIERLALRKRDIRIKKFKEDMRNLVNELYGGP